MHQIGSYSGYLTDFEYFGGPGGAGGGGGGRKTTHGGGDTSELTLVALTQWIFDEK